MADGLPLNFPLVSERGIGNYSFNNIQEGFGLVRYYLYASIDTGGTDYVISNLQPYSAVNDIGIDADTTVTYTFYSPVFNRARTMKGIAYFNFCFQYENGNAAPAATNSIKLYHYDGSTSTQLGSTWTSETYPLEAEKFRAVSGSITLSSPQRFSVGDQIKVEVIMSGDYGGVDNKGNIGISPTNDVSDFIDPTTDLTIEGGAAYTTFTLDIPYSLED